MSLKKVIITRPLAQALEFAEKMRPLNAEAIIFPLIDIHALDDQTELQQKICELSQYSLVVFISPNAIDAFMPHVGVWPSQLPIAVMGEGSKRALGKFGLTNLTAKIISPANELKTDSETLLEVLDLASLADKRVLVVRGDRGREFLSDTLQKAGAKVQLLTAYRRSAPDLNCRKQEQLTSLLASENVWIITSSEALRTLMGWVERLNSNDFVAKMQHQVIIVPHARIAETAQRMGFHFITLTASGDESVLVALQSHV